MFRILSKLLGWDVEDRERQAGEDRRVAAMYWRFAAENNPNPALRWNPVVAPPAPEIVTLSREDAPVRPDADAALLLAMDRAGLDAGERERVLDALR